MKENELVKIKGSRILGRLQRSANNPLLLGFVDFRGDLYIGEDWDIEGFATLVKFICPCCLEDAVMCQKVKIDVVEESLLRGVCDVCEIEKLVKQVIDAIE